LKICLLSPNKMSELVKNRRTDRLTPEKKWQDATRAFRVSRSRTVNWKGLQKGKGCSFKKTISPRLTVHDSVMRLFVNSEEEPRLVPRKRGRINVRSSNLPDFWEYLFFLILDLPWLQSVVFASCLSIAFFLIFGFLFWITGGGFSYILVEKELSFRSCLFFTLQTFDNIGYGYLSPVTYNCDILASFTALLSNFVKIFFGGVLLHKLTNPKKLKYTNKFSDVAVRNENTMTFQIEGYETGVKCLSFRVARTFTSSTLCDSSFQLVYFKTFTDEDGYEKFEFQELDFEINKQLGRSRDISFSLPLLGLPWTVIHPIDKNSPLFGLSLQDMEWENGEVIGILEGCDEICAKNYQARWSYKACDIRENHEFVPCVKRDDCGFFSVDFGRLSKTRRVNPDYVAKPRVSPLKKIARRLRKGLKSTRRSLRKIGGSFRRSTLRKKSAPLKRWSTESEIIGLPETKERSLSTPLPGQSLPTDVVGINLIDNMYRGMIKGTQSRSVTSSDKYILESGQESVLPLTASTTIERMSVNTKSDEVGRSTDSISDIHPESFVGLRRRHSRRTSPESMRQSARRSPASGTHSAQRSPEVYSGKKTKPLKQ